MIKARTLSHTNRGGDDKGDGGFDKNDEPGRTSQHGQLQHWRVEQMTLSVRRQQYDPKHHGDPLRADDSVRGYDADGRAYPLWSFASEEHCCAHRTHAVVVFLNGFGGRCCRIFWSRTAVPYSKERR